MQKESSDFTPPSSNITSVDDEMSTPLELNPLQGFSYVNRDGEDVTVDEQMQEWICKKISSTFDRLDNDKSKHKRRWKRTQRAVQGVTSSVTTDRFNGLVPFGKQTVQTLISHFWGRSLQTPNILFNVRGMDETSKDNAQLQKENMMRIFKKDRLQQKLDDGIQDAIMKGVIVGYVSYKQVSQDMAAPSNLLDSFPHNTEDNISQTGLPMLITEDNSLGMAEFSKMEYDAASLKIVDPYDFVFDTDNCENWDQCFKALQVYEVYEDIADNSNYQNFEELFDIASEKIGNTSSDTRFFQKAKKDVKTGVDSGGRIELIEFHGDFRLKDGTYLRNWTITVAARKKVIRFERNPSYINPFVKWTYEKTADGWGLAPIDYILPLIDAGSMLLNTGVEAAKLSINPPYLAPKGMMPQKQYYLQEGMTIEYSPNNALPDHIPQQIKLNPQVPFPYLQLLETQAEATTGATRQLSGNVTSNDNSQTATEFQGLQVVGNLILDRLVDLFNADFKIPVIEKMAKITAMFNPEETKVPIENEQGLTEFKAIGPEVYFGNYEYIIEDNKSELERKQNIQNELQFVTMLAQDQDVSPRLKKIDTAKEVFRDLGYGNPANLFMTDEEFVAQRLKDVALAQFIAQLSSQFPLGQMAMANGGKLDPNMLMQISQQAAMQAQGVVQNAIHPQGNPSPQPSPPPQAGIPQPAHGAPNMAAGSTGMESVPGIPPITSGQLPSAG
jgi:hypothetical protein